MYALGFSSLLNIYSFMGRYNFFLRIMVNHGVFFTKSILTTEAQ